VIYPQPVYVLTLAFDSRPLVTCFGLAGLCESIPRLDANLFSILDPQGRELGAAALTPLGDWWLDVGGVKAGPGFIIV
jgi:hypothetical protein